MMPSDPEQLPEKVPVFPSWNHWYAVVVALLVLQILLFFFITKQFA